MMKRLLPTASVALLFAFICGEAQLYAEPDEVPANMIAAILIKVAGFEKNLSGSSGDLTIYVMGAPNVAEELKTAIGKKIGQATVANVEKGENLPGTKPALLYIGNATKVDEAIQYSRTNKILSVSGIPELVAKGVTVGIDIGEDGKPKILLNLTSSAAEGLDWNPALLKFAQTMK
jgi:hypothetical protein